MTQDYYCIKMHASRDEENAKIHISGAEKIVTKDRLDAVCSQLLSRALTHSKGNPDFINIKLERVSPDEIQLLNALPVTTRSVKSAAEGQRMLDELLFAEGLSNSSEILKMMPKTYNMRGAMLLNADTMERLEPDKERGIRATYMDMTDDNDNRTCKNHFREALVLASKVANHKNIIGELCISDDPDYVTGYFASKKAGYVRITRLKEEGDPNGGRIFLFRGNHEDAMDCIRYLEHQKILVRMQEEYQL